jgi:hypothetical protein
MDDLDSTEESFVESHVALIVFAIILAGVIAYLIVTNIQPLGSVLNPGG